MGNAELQMSFIFREKGRKNGEIIVMKKYVCNSGKYILEAKSRKHITKS